MDECKSLPTMRPTAAAASLPPALLAAESALVSDACFFFRSFFTVCAQGLTLVHDRSQLERLQDTCMS